MQWELIATWLALLFTIGGVVFAMGRQSQKIDSQQDQIDELKENQKASQELPIKLASLETDMKYLIRELSDMKQFLMRKAGE